MDTCKYHPLRKAKLYCHYCQKLTCDHCVSEPVNTGRYDEAIYPTCFVCGGEVELADVSAGKVPFWRRLGEVHLYPLSINGLLIILITAFLTAYLMKIQPLLVLIPTAILYNYCFTCLRSTAENNLKAPSFIGSINANFGVLFSLFGMFIVYSILLFVATKLLGATGAMVVIVLGVFSFPAILIKYAIDESFIDALSIPNVFSIIRVCGISYFILLLFIFILTGSMGYLSTLVTPEELNEKNLFLTLFLGTIVSNYFGIVIFHILGYLVLQNASELGFSSGRVEIELKQRSSNKIMEAKAEVLVKEGEYQSATNLYHRLVKLNQDILKYQHKYFKLITETRNIHAVNMFTDKYWKKLIETGDEMALVDSYLKIRSFMKDYSPEDVELGVEVAEIFYQNSEHIPAIKLLQSLAKNNDDKMLLSKVFLLTAKSMAKIPKVAHQAKAYALMSKRAAEGL